LLPDWRRCNLPFPRPLPLSLPLLQADGRPGNADKFNPKRKSSSQMVSYASHKRSPEHLKALILGGISHLRY
jgi:hypothetical protein